MSFFSPVTFSVPPPNHPSILCPINSCRVSDNLGTFVPTTLYQILGLEQQHGHQKIFIKKKTNENPSIYNICSKNFITLCYKMSTVFLFTLTK